MTRALLYFLYTSAIYIILNFESQVLPDSTQIVQTALIHIPKPSVLLISQPSPLRLINHLFLAFIRSARTPPILPYIIQKQHKRQGARRCLRGQHGDLRRAILWRIPRLEGLRTDDIAHGERASHERTGERALRVSGTVRHRPLVENGQRSDNRIDKVNANQDTGLVVLRQERHKRAPGDAGNSAEDKPSPAVGNPTDTDADGQRKEDTDDARGCIKECRVRRRKPEAVD